MRIYGANNKKNTIQNETDGMDPPSLQTNYIATVAIFTACTSRFPLRRKIVVSTRHPRFKSERIFWSLSSAHALHQLKHVDSTSFKLQQHETWKVIFHSSFFFLIQFFSIRNQNWLFIHRDYFNTFEQSKHSCKLFSWT